MQGRPLTGVVVDSGASATHVVPVVDGYVLGSSIRSVPVAGDSASQWLEQLLRWEGGTPYRCRAVRRAHQRMYVSMLVVTGER